VPTRPTSVAKRQAVLAAAESAFLGGGYASVTMDDIAVSSGVAKQTVYAYFGSKQGLFLDLVTSMTTQTGDRVHREPIEIATAEDLSPELTALLRRQLDLVLAPRMLQLRRLVIGEVRRFPALARAVAEKGPLRAIRILTDLLTDLDARGVLAVPNPAEAASQLNWLVMGEPINNAMFFGDDAVPTERERTRHVAHAIETFLSAYGVGAQERKAKTSH
jgi:AcrR family transcriptional regulator